MSTFGIHHGTVHTGREKTRKLIDRAQYFFSLNKQETIINKVCELTEI